MTFLVFFFKPGKKLHFKSDSIHVREVFKKGRQRFTVASPAIAAYENLYYYLTNAMATPPSTFKTFPVDLLSKPPTKAKQAFAMSSGKITSFNNVRFA